MNDFTAERYTGLLTSLKAKIESDEFVQRHRRSAKDFTRKRCLTFVIVLLFLMNMIKRALQPTLSSYA